MKSPFASKTVWIGILEILIGVAGLLIPFFQTGEYTAAAYTALVAGVLTIVMRFVSSEPVGFK
jgi:hypothetical protein